MSRFHSLTVAQVQSETRDCIAVTFAVPPELRDSFAFQPGQRLVLRTTIGGAEVRRSYSICSAVQDGTLRVAIKRTAGGQFSTWANASLRPGAVLDVMPPMGHFHVPLHPEHRKHYLAFAAGSGITPVLSILKTTLATEPQSRFTLVYGNRASSSVIFRNELMALKDLYLDRLAIVHVMSREQQDIELFNGRITKEKTRQLLRHWIAIDDCDTAFLCGPEGMIRDVTEALREAGMPAASIRAELFAAAVPRHQPRTHGEAPAAEELAEVTVIQDGGAATFTMAKDRESILDAGLRAGLDMRYSCKSGVCSTCRCKVVDGKVDMDASYALEDYEIARGFVLSCQAFPATDRVVIDFDQAE